MLARRRSGSTWCVLLIIRCQIPTFLLSSAPALDLELWPFFLDLDFSLPLTSLAHPSVFYQLLHHRLFLPHACGRIFMSAQPSLADSIRSAALTLQAVTPSLKISVAQAESSGNPGSTPYSESIGWDQVSSVAPGDQLPLFPGASGERIAGFP